MAVNVYDQAARYVIKLDPPGFFAWLSGVPQVTLTFRERLDTRTLPFPGDPDRTCDTVAALEEPGGTADLIAVVVEAQSEPHPDILERILEYLSRFRRELRHGPDRGRKYRVGGTVLNLTGPEQQDTLDAALPSELGAEFRFKVRQRTLREEDAAATVAAIAAGQVARCILPFVPLMRGGAEAGIIEEWKRWATAEPEGPRRSDYAGLALVFAELVRVRDAWRRGLEGWNVLQSQQVLEWQAMARAEARAEAEIRTTRKDLLRLLELKFSAPLPADLVNTIQATTDLDKLTRWFDTAVTAPSLDAFRAAAQP
jgi:hypothetical protein